MKKYILTLTAVMALLTACGDKPKPSTTPLHPAQPGIVATTDDEIRSLVTSMTGSTEWSKFLTADFLSMMDEARHLVMGNEGGETYVPFDWTCKTLASNDGNYRNEIEQINISSDSVTVDMKFIDSRHNKPYTLVLKHEKGHWCIDDVRWPDQQPPFDTERHTAGAYADDAITNLTTGDAAYIIATRLDALVPDAGDLTSDNPYETHPEALDFSIKCIETAHNFLKKNRGYTPQCEQKVLATLQRIKNMKQ